MPGKAERPTGGAPRRRAGRPSMAEDPKLRARNKRCLFDLLRRELTVAEVLAVEGLSRKQLRRALADAVTYPEIGDRVRELAAAMGYAGGPAAAAPA